MTERRAALSLLEIQVAIAILAVTLLSLMAVAGSAGSLREHSRESEAASSLLELELEGYRGLDLAQVYPTIRDQAPLAQPLATRQVATDDDGNPFLPGGTLTIEVLDEQTAQTVFNLATAPDLDGDGDPSTSDFARYSLVPLRMTITWTSVTNSPRSEELLTILYPSTTTETAQ